MGFVLREVVGGVGARRGVVDGRELHRAGGVLVGECGVGTGYAERFGVLVERKGAVRVCGLGGERVGGDGAGVFSD